jgi:hypothetical protein
VNQQQSGTTNQQNRASPTSERSQNVAS